MGNERKSVLDVIGWCKELESRLEGLEKQLSHLSEEGSFELENHPTLLQDGYTDKRVITPIKFAKPFESIPTLLPTIDAFSFEDSPESTLHVWAENITEDGADIVVRTWRTSKIYFVNIHWLALETKKT